jgi:hypothetical protein
MKEKGRAVLQQALNEGLDTEYICGRLVVGNRRGLNIARELSEMKLSINRQNLTIASLENRVASLTLVSEEYNLLRQRFLSTYKREVGKCTKKDWVIIQEGNAVAHGGDDIADSRLYLKSKRLNSEIFRELYGLDVLVVPLLSEFFSNQ